MTAVFRLEMKRGALALVIWSAVIAFMLGVSILIYPEMTGQMEEISAMFSDMGSFSAAFGMDAVNFGELTGYFSAECANTLGIGGALYAAMTGVSALSREERDRTAEFLLTHPIARESVILGKLLAMFAQITILNLTAAAVTALTILGIGTGADAGDLSLLLLSSYLMQLEIGAVTFGLSAFLHRNALGIGLGLAFVLYFLNILSNLTEDADFLKYITPFGYTEGQYILNHHALHLGYLAAGLALAAVGVAAAFLHYRRKDIA